MRLLGWYNQNLDPGGVGIDETAYVRLCQSFQSNLPAALPRG